MLNGLRITAEEIAADPDHAWGVFCNIAVPIMDAAQVGHKEANQSAAFIMKNLFDCDITTHEHYEYGKSPAQEYMELRIAAEAAEPTP